MTYRQIIRGKLPSKSKDNMKKVNDDILITAYHKLKNVWKVGELVGLSGQQVYDRLNKLGAVKHINYWTEKDNDVLREKYLSYKQSNNLDILASELGRTKQFICRKAKALGLTDKTHIVMGDRARRKISENTKRYIKEKGHPKGFLGHKHSERAKCVIGQKSKVRWQDHNSIFNSEPFKQAQSDRLHDRQMNGKIRSFSIRGNHPIFINEKEYVFKSSWEVEIAQRLQELFEHSLIQNWDYETKHFDFTDIKRGTRSYCPDFEITLNNGSNLYIEVKGWKMPNAMKRIEMFRERYPDVKFYLIDEKEYEKVLSESDYLRRRCI